MQSGGEHFTFRETRPARQVRLTRTLMDVSRAASDGRQELIDLLQVEMKRIRDKVAELKPQIDQTQM